MGRWRDIFFLLCTVLIWGTTFHVARFALQSFTPFSLAAVRFLFGALFLVLLTARWRDRRLFLRKGFVLHIILLGAIGVGLYNLLFYEGIARINPAKAALIAASNPGITAFLMRFWKKEVLPLRAFLGIALAFSGVALVVVDSASGWTIETGDLLILGAAISWSVYSIAARDMMRDYEQRVVTVYSVAAGAAMLPWFVGSDWLDLTFSPGPFLAVLYMAVFSTGFAYIWWARGVQSLGPARAAVFMNLVPLTALLIEIFLGGQIEIKQWLGGALVLSGVWLTNRRV